MAYEQRKEWLVGRRPGARSGHALRRRRRYGCPSGVRVPVRLRFYEGSTVRTVVTPSAFPNRGTDPLYAVMGGASGQKAVVGVAPGDKEYNGGHWASHSVTWNVTPYLLTSEDAIDAAETASHVTVTRVAANDFLCPIQL